jgi:Fungal N-terminal domain of STAND proteins
MSAGFGFSVGDFISGIQLVRNLIKALKDSAGSSKEYLELIAELWSLESALVQVKAAYGEVQAPAQRVALGQAVQTCQQCIDDFLKSISKYHHHLNIHGTKSTIRDGFRKIQWHLTKPKEIGAFHTSIAAHVSSIQTLLVTIQVYVDIFDLFSAG